MSTQMLGVPANPYAPDPAQALLAAAVKLGVPSRALDLVSLRFEAGGVMDDAGRVDITHLAPGLLYGQPRAARVLADLISDGVKALNSVAAIEVADDKVLTAEALSKRRVPQPAWVEVPEGRLEAAFELGFPLILKRPVGALGMWVSRVTSPEELPAAASTLLREGGQVLLAQKEVTECLGTAIRVIVVSGRAIAATVRTAEPGEWRSNVARGGSQQGVVLTSLEEQVAVSAAVACGTGFAGVDVVRSFSGPLVLEVNASPGFTSMRKFVSVDIASEVVRATLSL